MSKFKVGEVVILQSVDFPQFNGKEMTVLESLIRQENGNNIQIYITDFEATDEDDYTYNTGWQECALRKLPDGYDGNKTCSWESCEWKPAEVTA